MQILKWVVFVAQSTVAIYNFCKVVGATLKDRDAQCDAKASEE